MTLRAVLPPPELAPRYALTDTGYVEITDYDRDNYLFSGVFHALLDEFGSRDVTLAHFNGTIYELAGWAQPTGVQWLPVYGRNATEPGLGVAFPEEGSRATFLTQFLKLPSGILCIPQGGRAVVFDGYRALPLGYDHGPGSPDVRGPQDIADKAGANRLEHVNEGGYSLSGRTLPYSFGTSRKGTVDNTSIESTGAKSNMNGGILLQGEIRCVMQWINDHGDMSPLSPPSTAWTVSKEDNLTKDRRGDDDEPVKWLLHQALWSALANGPDGTVGKILGETRDLRNSGDPVFYEVPPSAAGGLHTFATIPDNSTTFFPSNVPERWLVTPVTEVDPMPLFRLAALFMGRLWIANTVANPGLLRASLPARWGTMPKDKDIFYPDPTGAEVTGLFAAKYGLLVFTARSTFLVQPNDDGSAFQFASLSNSVGCVSPDSIATLQDGSVVWLSREGFHRYDGESMEDISEPVKRKVRSINHTVRHRATATVDPDMGEYRCWVAVDESERSNYCFVYDGRGWRELDYMMVDASCVTTDDRQYVLALGSFPTMQTAVAMADSLFVLDRQGAWTRELEYTTPLVTVAETPRLPTWTYQTHWLKSGRSDSRTSPVRITLWLRETRSEGFRVAVYRDYRKYPAVAEIEATAKIAPDRWPTDDPPTFLDIDELGETIKYEIAGRTPRGSVVRGLRTMRERRPYWTKVDIAVPACEVFSFELEGTGDMEILAVQFSDNVHSQHGGTGQTGGKR